MTKTLSQKKSESGSLESNLHETKSILTETKKQLCIAQEGKLKYETKCRGLNELVCQLKGNIRVFIRLRPLLGEYELGKGMKHISFGYDKEGNDQILISSDKGHETKVTVDKIMPENISQSQIFSEIETLITSALYGHHVCIFAYGQTGSGKTYSMEGPEIEELDDSTRGIIPRSMEYILKTSKFDDCWTYEFSANYIEIYVDKVYDLLNGDGEKITVRADDKGIQFSPSLKSEVITDMFDFNKLLQTAHKRRRTASTNFNERSSRSHSIFILNISAKNSEGKVQNSSVQLIDLAGSENAKQSGEAGGQGLIEARAINTSLTALSQMISKVRLKAKHIKGYRLI